MMSRAGVFRQPEMQVDPMKDSRIRCLRFRIGGKNSARLMHDQRRNTSNRTFSNEYLSILYV